MKERILRGVKNPRKFPSYLLSRVVPASILKKALDFQPNEITYDDERGFQKFELGGYASGTRDKIEFAARNYYEISSLWSILEEYGIYANESVEIGSGYGRISPWISEFSESHYGVEPDRKAIDQSKSLYPQINWVNKRIQDTSFKPQSFDLVVTWTVLQHIPESDIGKTLSYIEKITQNGGFLILCEETEGDDYGPHTWPRNVEVYQESLGNSVLLDTYERKVEPTSNHSGKIMVFRKSDSDM